MTFRLANELNWLQQWLFDSTGYDSPGQAIREFVVFLIAYWEVLQVVLIVTAIVTLLSSLEDLFLDIMYWLIALFGNKSQPRFNSVRNKTQKQIAVLVPAWQESDVIARMLANTTGTTHYEKFHIFVGVYANDPRTRDEVDSFCQHVQNVHRIDIGHDGPTSKADCLNGLVRGILEFERRQGISFEIFANHDAEDVVHPFAFHVMNYFIDGYGMLQLPVRSLDRGTMQFVAGHYMDEFAEWHGKDLIVRAALAKMTPSAGVGTATSRQAMEALLRSGNGMAFNVESLTEDYDVAHRLRRLGFASRFVRYFAPMPVSKTSWLGLLKTTAYRRQLVDTREYFPHRISASIRQKARWMLGISYFGWRQLGWQGDLANRYFLMRDRKVLITAPAAMIGYLLVIHWLINTSVVLAYPQFDLLPPLVTQDWVWSLIFINFLLMSNRLFHRALFVGKAHGLKHVWLSPVRAVLGNYIAFRAFLRATQQFLWHTLTGSRIAWDKTQHQFPVSSRLRQGRIRLGEILTHWGMVSTVDVNKALAAQRSRYRPLGLQLLDHNALDDDSLAHAFGELFGTRSRSFDPLEIPNGVRELLPRDVAGRLAAFVIDRTGSDQALLALGEPLTEKQQLEINRRFRRHGISKIDYQFAPLSDLAFGVRYAYDDTTLGSERQIIAELRRRSLIGSAQEKLLWRAIRKEYVRLGDILVRRRSVRHSSIMKALIQKNRRRLGERLRKMGVLAGGPLKAGLELQLSPPIDVVGIAVRIGLITSESAAQIGRSSSGNRSMKLGVAAQ